MTELVVNDVLIDLREENNNLIKDLNLTIKLLETYRNCLICFTKNCKCIGSEEKTKFDKLEDYFNKVNHRIAVNLKDKTKDDVQTDKQTNYRPKPKSKQLRSDDNSIDGNIFCMKFSLN